MKIKKLWLVMLIAALLFSMMTFGCDDADEWSPVTSLSQLNGKWKGSISESESLYDPEALISFDATMTMTMTMDVTFNSGAKTMSGTMTMTERFTGKDAAAVYTMMKAMLTMEGTPEGYTFNDSNHSVSMTEAIPSTPIPEDYINEIEINQTGRKIRSVYHEDEETGKKTYIIMTKQ